MAKMKESASARDDRIMAEKREFHIRPWEYHPESAPATRPFAPGFMGWETWPKADELRRKMKATGLTFRELMAKKGGAAP